MSGRVLPSVRVNGDIDAVVIPRVLSGLRIALAGSYSLPAVIILISVDFGKYGSLGKSAVFMKGSIWWKDRILLVVDPYAWVGSNQSRLQTTIKIVDFREICIMIGA